MGPERQGPTLLTVDEVEHYVVVHRRNRGMKMTREELNPQADKAMRQHLLKKEQPKNGTLGPATSQPQPQPQQGKTQTDRSIYIGNQGYGGRPADSDEKLRPDNDDFHLYPIQNTSRSRPEPYTIYGKMPTATINTSNHPDPYMLRAPATTNTSSRPGLYGTHSSPVPRSAQSNAMERPALPKSQSYGVGDNGDGSASLGPQAVKARSLLGGILTGASRDGDKRQSLKRDVKLDTGSPENLVSLRMCEDLGAEIIRDDDYLLGAERTPLEVKGAAMIWLAWIAKDGKGRIEERKELIYCLVVENLAFDLIVSEEKDEDLFSDLRAAAGPWRSASLRSAAPILDKMTPQEREACERRRETVLAEARTKQARKDSEYAEQRRRLGQQRPGEERDRR